MSGLRCVVGLGNPGKEYENTRHNAGFIAVDYIAYKLGITFKPMKGNFYCATYLSSESQEIFFIKPTTFMNMSGWAVYDFALMENIKPEEILVVLDDFSLEFGQIRIRKKGSDGGHKGLGSIIYMFNTDNIPRLRIGIGPLPEGVDPVEYVLSPFSEPERAELENVLKRVYEAVFAIIEKGIDYAMNRFNRTKKEVKNE